MGSSSADMLPIVQRSYDLCAALYEHVNRFPRAQRTLLGRVMLDDGLRMLGPRSGTTGPPPWHRRSNERVEKL